MAWALAPTLGVQTQCTPQDSRASCGQASWGAGRVMGTAAEAEGPGLPAPFQKEPLEPAAHLVRRVPGDQQRYLGLPEGRIKRRVYSSNALVDSWGLSGRLHLSHPTVDPGAVPCPISLLAGSPVSFIGALGDRHTQDGGSQHHVVTDVRGDEDIVQVLSGVGTRSRGLPAPSGPPSTQSGPLPWQERFPSESVISSFRCPVLSGSTEGFSTQSH